MQRNTRKHNNLQENITLIRNPTRQNKETKPIMTSILASAFQRKSLHLMREQAHMSDSPHHQHTQSSHSTTNDETSEEAPHRHMSIYDLLSFGIGCTIGSGVFVLAGLTANAYAGPGASISYLFAGLVAAANGLPYAELSAVMPLDGSTYEYAYVSLGEIFAVMASLCQTLEYGGSAAAVARSWGEKFVDWLKGDEFSENDDLLVESALPQWAESLLEPGYGINPMAAIIASICTYLLLWGVKESKFATNLISTIKISLIAFMIIGGFVLSSGVVPDDENNPRPASFSHWKPFVPEEYGLSGILRGSSILFFAFIGFDQVCNLSGETKNPVTDVPRAVILTLLVDAVLYMLAALALTAMVPYDEISLVSGFPRAFGVNGWLWAEKMTALGEITTLPLVVLTAIQSQSRLLFAMSKDKLVPSAFGKMTYETSNDGTEKMGNLTDNLRICGVVVVLIATFIPFEYLDDLISAGVLFLFSLTDVCLLTIRYKSPSHSFLGDDAMTDDEVSYSLISANGSLSVGNLIALLNIFSMASGLSFSYCDSAALRYFLSGTFALLTIFVTIYMARSCEQSESTHYALEGDGYGTGKKRFRTPFVPYLPAFGIFLNSFMMAHIHWVGLIMLLGYLSFGVFGYAYISARRDRSENDEVESESMRILELS
mmetsp:Transcript_16753/g.33343  ORF Transcript_16753/g.33343 Transcript_16753/m.33343 type:complete len:658 (-) Transcript_16753:178-2151(-)